MARGPSLVGDVLSWGRGRLARGGILDGSQDWILSRIFDSKLRNGYQKYLMRRLTEQQKQKAIAMITERAEGAPLQHVIGEWGFLDFQLLMRRPVFIPRPETEGLFLHARALVELQGLRGPRILEIGSGSGALSIAFLRSFPTARVTAVDCSIDAVRLTTDNAAFHGFLKPLPAHRRFVVHHMKVTSEGFVDPETSAGASLRDNVDSISPANRETFGPPFDLVISNPPYVPSPNLPMLSREIIDHEDLVALNGGKDGLDVVRHILKQLPELLRSGKLFPSESEESNGAVFPESAAFFEVDVKHPEQIRELLESEEPYKSTLRFLGSFRDFNRQPRYVLVGRRIEAGASHWTKADLQAAILARNKPWL